MATQLVLLLFILPTLSNFAAASELRLHAVDDCGRDFNNTICTDNHCCSSWGHCGDTALHCCGGCQSQCHCPSPSPAPSPPHNLHVFDVGGWSGALDGKYAWGYCYFLDWAVADSSHNYKGVSDPTNATLVFENAIRYWMTEQARKPSCHSVMTGGWIPTDCDIDAGRLPGFGVTTNVIDGEGECGEGETGGAKESGEDRIGYYQHFCGDDLLAVDPGNYLDCYNQVDFTKKPPCPGWTVI